MKFKKKNVFLLKLPPMWKLIYYYTADYNSSLNTLLVYQPPLLLLHPLFILFCFIQETALSLLAEYDFLYMLYADNTGQQRFCPTRKNVCF
jgi:hypothetical protein